MGTVIIGQTEIPELHNSQVFLCSYQEKNDLKIMWKDKQKKK